MMICLCPTGCESQSIVPLCYPWTPPPTRFTQLLAGIFTQLELMRGTNNQKAASPREGWITVYCDGACKNNGKANAVAGIGVWWGPRDYRNAAERCPGAQTNNRAELVALIRVLETVPRNKTPLMIRTDSKYTIDCFREWIPKWRRNGWKTSKGEPVKNESIIRYLDALLAERSELGQEVELDYVAGHKGHEGNEGADRLANDGCLLPEVADQDWNALEAQTRQRTAKSRSLLDDVNPVDAGAVVETIPGRRSMLAKGKEKAVESETEITSDGKIQTQTQSISIPPVQLKWAAYEPIPDSWLLESSPGPSPASSASDSFSFSFGSASTSSSIHSSKNESRHDSEFNAVRDSFEPAVDALTEEELRSFFLEGDDLTKELDGD